MMPLLVGIATGVLSSWGIGGGTLLLLYLFHFTDLTQEMAQSTNLLFFIPAGLLALPSHKKGGFLKGTVSKYGIVGGVVGAILGAFVGQTLDTQWLQRGFSLLLISVGGFTLWKCRG